ncbi:hypothetical protein [Staphylococcus rostri]|uniref:Uncharacterized protein n=1 Tax=Staphylococcus rostri TaxID=522262 RepID=A0A2K3YGL5_9STAP|nr:hypothetical protein [Staphylococcus rostri]PNZ24747.1 hypothetical protein CD122_10755 [Staphylococcus rostri]
MEVIQPQNCANAPKQATLLSYVILDMTEDAMDQTYILSHGKLASIFGYATKGDKNYKISYFAEFQSHKRDSTIKHIEKMVELNL